MERRYSKTEESVAFSVRRPSQAQSVGEQVASLTIVSSDADAAVYEEEQDVQMSLDIKTKRKTSKVKHKRQAVK